MPPKKTRNTSIPKITQLPSGAYHTLIYSHTDENGKRHYESITGYDYNQVMLDAVNFKADKKRARVEAGSNQKNPTLREAFENYIAAKDEIISPSTKVGYMQIARNALPDLMPVRILDITQELVQVAINAEAATKSPKTVRNIHGLLAAVLALYRPTFVLTTTLPKKQKAEIAIPTKEEVEIMVKQTYDTVMEVPIVLGAYCGMRRSEIAALTWDRIDFERELIDIRYALVLDGNKQWVKKAPKTAAGTRIVPMYHPIIKEALLRAKAHHEASESPYITITPDHITQRFYHICNRAQTQIYTFHQLRHYCVSVMLALDFPKAYIADLVGHESEDMINLVYGHIMAEKKAEFQNRLSAFYKTDEDPLEILKKKSSMQN